MTDAAIQIPNLLYRYAEAFDDGDFPSAARLFDRGHLLVGDTRVTGVDAIVAMWLGWVKLHDGKPRTRHITTNPIIDLAPDGQTATCRSQWTVIQAADDYPLQIVASGRYHDRFALTDDTWHFTERAYAQVDLTGNTDAHLLKHISGGER